MPNSSFTPQIPAANQYSNLDLNSFGSQYASLYGHQLTAHIQRQVQELIFDAAPQGFYDDLKILMMNGAEDWKSDEVFYHESVWGRDTIVATATASAATTQTFAVTPASFQTISVDVEIAYPNNQKGTVVAMNPNTNEITVRAMSGQTLPSVAVNDIFAQHSTVAADGTNKISNYSRVNTIERFNYIQLLAKATRFGKVEMIKYVNSGTTNYLAVNKKNVLDQFRTDMSNIYWNGERGEVTLADGSKAKTAGGIIPTQIAAGAPVVTTTIANIRAGFEDLVLSTQFNRQGSKRFFYATPRMINTLSQSYKFPLTRYVAPDKHADMGLNMITVGQEDIVLVGVKSFEAQSACFPASFENQGVLLDQETIKRVQLIGCGEHMGETPDRYEGSTNLNTYKDFWVDGSFSIKHQNPQAGGRLLVS